MIGFLLITMLVVGGLSGTCLGVLLTRQRTVEETVRLVMPLLTPPARHELETVLYSLFSEGKRHG